MGHRLPYVSPTKLKLTLRVTALESVIHVAASITAYYRIRKNFRFISKQRQKKNE